MKCVNRHQVTLDMEEDLNLKAVVAKYEEELGSQMSKQVGESAVDLDSRCEMIGPAGAGLRVVWVDTQV